MSIDCTILIMTYNDEKHIARCIESLSNMFVDVVVIDSFSIDGTVSISKALGATVVQNKFVCQSHQLNWYLDNHKIHSEWVFRLDSDEIVTSELKSVLSKVLHTIQKGVSGLTINRRIYFLGKWIRYGSIYPISVLRIWRNGLGRCENRWMDEHIVVEGAVQHITGDVSDINLNSLTWWVDKHNNYASREAIEILLAKNKTSTPRSTWQLDSKANRKRWIKEVVYSKITPGVRSLLYFFYRYFLRFGFLDGSKGAAFHILQGFWYRFLVDQKVREIERLMKSDDINLECAVQKKFNINLGKLTDRKS